MSPNKAGKRKKSDDSEASQEVSESPTKKSKKLAEGITLATSKSKRQALEKLGSPDKQKFPEKTKASDDKEGPSNKAKQPKTGGANPDGPTTPAPPGKPKGPKRKSATPRSDVKEASSREKDREVPKTPQGAHPKSSNPTTPAVATPGTIGRYNISPPTVKGIQKIGGKLKSLMIFVIEVIKVALDKKEMPADADIGALLSTVVKKLVQTFPGL